jgi:hypothetical protein
LLGSPSQRCHDEPPFLALQAFEGDLDCSRVDVTADEATAR